MMQMPISTKRTKTTIVFALMVISLILCSCTKFQTSNKKSLDELKDTDKTGSFGDIAIVLIQTEPSKWVEVNAEVAKSPSERAKGLMYRESLDPDKGMLFVFSEPEEQNFWMKNTLIPLDMIFISEDQKVAAIQKNAVPCKEDPCRTYSSNIPVQYVLEVNSGFSSKHGINPGDHVQFVIGHEDII